MSEENDKKPDAAPEAAADKDKPKADAPATPAAGQRNDRGGDRRGGGGPGGCLLYTSPSPRDRG